MKPLRSAQAACIFCGLLSVAAPVRAQQVANALTRLDRIAQQVHSAQQLVRAGQDARARALVLRAYLDDYELLESTYGAVAKTSAPEVASEIAAGEAAFHAVMRAGEARSLQTEVAALDAQLTRIRDVFAGTQLVVGDKATAPVTAHAIVAAAAARTTEIREILREFAKADALYRSGSQAQALAIVEHSYLERFEPLESRIPRPIVDKIEKLIHLQLRPAMKQQADAATVTSLMGVVGQELTRADRFLVRGGSAWFAIVNSFVIVVREGLEAVLLIAALLAYLGAIGAAARHRRQIYGGMAAGVVATIGTWFLASTLLPISGANRELLEGITALTAVAVLMYVGHWLFQKTYIHDWKDYLRQRVGGAVTRGSALAMATLAFAAVYREGFETVLFYQALAFDSGVAAILAGFIPGALLIVLLGVAIIRAGVKLPLKKVFAGTNALLMYLAFVFIGKGLYNLQEAGVFAPHPLRLPDHPALRQLFGFYPVAETLGAQLAFVALLAATYVISRRRIQRKQAAAAHTPIQPRRNVA